jgi:hypothetical protein
MSDKPPLCFVELAPAQRLVTHHRPPHQLGLLPDLGRTPVIEVSEFGLSVLAGVQTDTNLFIPTRFSITMADWNLENLAI